MPLDPSNSRPLDVHRWSDHPQTREITETIWNTPAFEDLREAADRRGPRPKKRHKDQLRVLIIDLYVCHLEDPDQCLGVKMRRGDWKANNRYNALHLSNILPDLVHRLHGAGFIELAPGSYAGRGGRGNRTTRIKADEPLIALFDLADAPREEFEPPEQQEMIVLRDLDGNDADYEDTQQTQGWRRQLSTYNEALWETFIDLPSLNEPFFERPITAGPRQGQMQRIPVGGRGFIVRRVFSRGSWDCNGRLYGGWWQQTPKELRRHIHLDDEPTVEIDYKGIHIDMPAKERDQVIEGDPYAVDR